MFYVSTETARVVLDVAEISSDLSDGCFIVSRVTLEEMETIGGKGAGQSHVA